MIDPLFWLGFSLLLVAVSLAAVLIVALPTLHELARAARSAEKLFDTLNRELPPTLEAIRLTGLEVSNLTDEMNEGVQNAGRIVQQLDQSISNVGQQAKRAQIVTHSLFAGVRAAWKSFARPIPEANAEENITEENIADDRSHYNHSGNLSGRLSGNSIDRVSAQSDLVEPNSKDECDPESGEAEEIQPHFRL